MVSKPTSLRAYRKKRDFRKTPEPAGRARHAPRGRSFVVQKHAARRLHYDFRLEIDGVLKSWAVPKGPSLDPSEKRLAVHVEDHPLEYGRFEGVIPEGQYGGGAVMLWDRGEWTPRGQAAKDYVRGRLKFELKGTRLRGAWVLVRMDGSDDNGRENWLLFKERDEFARSGRTADVSDRLTRSVATGRSLKEIADARDQVWMSDRAVRSTSGGAKHMARTSPQKAARSARSQPEVSPELLTGARKAPMPQQLRPQLATLVKDAPTGDKWLHEIKFDGFRLLCFVDSGRARLITRNGQDWTHRFGRVAAAAMALPVSQAVLDGEVVVQKADGTNDFQALQNVLEGKHTKNLVYFAFDLPYCEGYDISQAELMERKALLRQLIEAAGPKAAAIRYSDHVQGSGPEVFRQACTMAVEGIISKRADSRYEQRRTLTWTKAKCTHRQEFVIGGFTDPAGSRAGFGALLVGYYTDAADLIYAGRVGTGFKDALLERLTERLKKSESKAPAFVNPPRGREARGVHWVRPELVAEVDYGSWTNDGLLRHPSFQGLREDRKPAEVRLERAIDLPDGPARQQPVTAGGGRPNAQSRSKARAVAVAGVTITNPDRVLYPEQNVTKSELAGFYERIADWILPHVVARPLSVVRCPQGQPGQCFYQKHVKETMGSAVRGVEIREKSGVEKYIVIDDLTGLITLVQFGALEFHPWGARADNVERPDRAVFDLDPGPGVPWMEVVRAAGLLRERLEDLGLQSFVKTSGGKGLHVVLPLQRRTSWDKLKEFTGAIAESIAGAEPDKFLTTAAKARRAGKIFIDYFRNGRGATSIAPYSTRARPGAPVSTPLAWDELTSSTGPDDFTVSNLPARLGPLHRDPWEGFFDVRQSVTTAMRRRAGRRG